MKSNQIPQVERNVDLGISPGNFEAHLLPYSFTKFPVSAFQVEKSSRNAVDGKDAVPSD